MKYNFSKHIYSGPRIYIFKSIDQKFVNGYKDKKQIDQNDPSVKIYQYSRNGENRAKRQNNKKASKSTVYWAY